MSEIKPDLPVLSKCLKQMNAGEANHLEIFIASFEPRDGRAKEFRRMLANALRRAEQNAANSAWQESRESFASECGSDFEPQLDEEYGPPAKSFDEFLDKNYPDYE